MTSNSKAGPYTPFWRRMSKQSVVGLLAAVAVVELAFWLLAVKPLNNREAEELRQTQLLEQQLETKLAAVEKLRETKAKVEEAVETGDELLAELTFDHQTTFSELLTEIGAAAQEAGVEVRETNYESDSIEGNDRYGMVTISANFRGQYDSLVKLLHRLDRSERFLIVERLAAAPRDEGDLAITMRIDAFVRDL